jgi:hypothetical protein
MFQANFFGPAAQGFFFYPLFYPLTDKERNFGYGLVSFFCPFHQLNS